jgi:hypothetical protein
MHKSIALGSILALGLAGQAYAQDGFSYSYVEAAYLNSELDDFDVDGDGFAVAGSIEFGSNFFGFANYADQDYDFDVGRQDLGVGVGYHWPLNPRLDLVTKASYLDLEVDVPGFGDFDEDGFGVGLGLRGRALDQLELTADVNYVDLGDADDTTFSVGGRYYFTSAFAAGLDVGFNDDGTTWGIAARYDFGGK